MKARSNTSSPTIALELPDTRPERRVRTRADGEWQARCKFDTGATRSATILDLGIGGARLAVEAPDAEVGNRVAIQVDDSIVAGRIVGTVVREEGIDEIRVRFEDLGLEDLLAIGELVGNPFPRPKHPTMTEC